MVVIAIMGILAAILLPALSRALESARRATCLAQLKQFGIIFAMYSGEHEGLYPPVASFADPNTDYVIFSAPDASTVFPDYATDMGHARCPSDSLAHSASPDLVWRLPETGDFGTWQRDAIRNQDRESYYYYLSAELGRSYCYRGYVMTTVSEYYGVWAAFVAQPTLRTADIALVGPVLIKDYTDVLEMPTHRNWPGNAPPPEKSKGTNNTRLVQRLRVGIETYYAETPQTAPARNVTPGSIPVMWDAFGSVGAAFSAEAPVNFNHVAGGGNVLYLDGHAEFVRFGVRFPYVNDPGLLVESAQFGMR